MSNLFAPLVPTVNKTRTLVKYHTNSHSISTCIHTHLTPPPKRILPIPHKSLCSSPTQLTVASSKTITDFCNWSQKDHQDLIFPMDSTKNPNLETYHTIISSASSQSFKRTHEGEHKSERSSTSPAEQAGKVVVESGREKLKRHRVEMSGRVWIPDIWGQEDLLKKWIDCTVFDSCLEKSSIMSARDALIQEGRSTLTIENSC